MNKLKPICLDRVIFTSIFLIIIVSLLFFSSYTFEPKPNEKVTFDYSVPLLPEDINFCGEHIPIDNPDVKERLERELIVNKYFHSYVIQGLRRTQRWFPLIEEILAKNNIPDDFKYLALIESNLENVISPKGATGFWQIMPATGKELGMTINDEIDERYDVIKSTEAACKYLKNAYSLYGNWISVAVSYNAGMGGISRQKERQKTRNFFDLHINEETSRYIFRILALKDVVNNPEKFGYYFRDNDYLKPHLYREISINSSIDNWVDFAISNKITYRTLRLHNPWIRDYKFTNKTKKTYTIKLPN